MLIVICACNECGVTISNMIVLSLQNVMISWECETETEPNKLSKAEIVSSR